MLSTDRVYELNPFLHYTSEEIYNPLTDTAVCKNSAEYRLLSAHANLGAETLYSNTAFQLMIDQQFLIPLGSNISQQYFLKYVSIETHTVCNHKCHFCPVSQHTRQRHFMDIDFFKKIAVEIAELPKQVKGVFLNGYNEPTIDPNFVEQIRILSQLDIDIAVNSNGSGLSPDTVDDLMKLGGVEYLCINLSTIDEEKFLRDRKANHLSTIMRNMDYLSRSKLAKKMHIVVLGSDDNEHEAAYKAIIERFCDSPFEIRKYTFNSRSGSLRNTGKSPRPHKRLKGCEQTGSRPLQHLHINAYGECILCCQDYYDEYIIGNLRTQTIDEVLTGPEISQIRRWAYGIDEAPDDFICRKCSFART